jgi:endonuclease YncB( thermonuclease family)
VRKALLWAALCLPVAARAHPGGVDASGCHVDKAAGERHCHPSRAGGSRKKAESFSGKVVAVKDGDTLEVLRGKAAVRVRLAEIDCPEKAQAWGAKAKQFTSGLAFGKTVTVLVTDTDRYGRLVAQVLLDDGRSLNLELVKAGLAWWYRAFSKDRSIGELESAAKRDKRGLWADPDPTPPWLFRRKQPGAV